MRRVLKHLPSLKKLIPIFLIMVIALVAFANFSWAADCKSMEEYQEEYRNCHACLTIKIMLEAFMSAASQTYPISQQGGNALLVIGAFLWVAFFIISKISTFTNPEAPKMTNEFLIFLFKILVAYIGVNAGASVLIDYFINPFLSAGADLGSAYLSFGLPAPDKVDGMTNSYVYNGPADIIDPNVLNKILAYTEGVSLKVANNMVIGNGLMCFALDDWHFLGIRFVNPIIWLCGFVIWIIGVCLTIFVSYYLLDISFKIGFAIIMLPLAIALWPFKPTKGRLKACFSIILRSAAVYALLAMCATLAMVIIDAVLDAETLFQYIKEDKVKEIADLFDITKMKFLILCFAFFYAIRLIGKNETLTNKLFPDQIFATISPIHNKLTGLTSLAHNKAMKPLGLGRDILTHQTGRAIRGVGKGIGKGASATGKAIGSAVTKKYKDIVSKNALKK